MSLLIGNTFVVMIGVGAAVFALIYINADKILNWLYNQSLGNREYVIAKLKSIFVEVDRKRITAAMLLGSFGVGALMIIAFWPNFTMGLLFGLVFTWVGWMIPKRLIDFYYMKRCHEFVDQMVDGLVLMSNAMRANAAVMQAIEIVANNMNGPIRQEFQNMLTLNRLGASIEDVFNELAKRIPLPDVQMFVTAVVILDSTGGSLPETFDTISRTIRERIKVEKKIAAVTAQGVMQGTIITFLPFVLIGVFYMMDPKYIEPLFATTLGWIILVVVLGLQILGGVMIRNIVKIKV